MGLGTKIPTKDEVKVEATNLALQKKAPCHKDKNSIGDAILFLSCVNALQNFADPILYFITDNKDDFSQSKEQPNLMHEDLIKYASEKGVTIKYHLSLNIALDEIFDEVTDEDYIKEYKKQYDASFRKCPKCNHRLLFDTHPWDGRGNKTFYKCENCTYTEETGQYN